MQLSNFRVALLHWYAEIKHSDWLLHWYAEIKHSDWLLHLYAEIKHSDWLLQVPWLVLTNQCA